MSHITDVKLRVRDLDALEQAAVACGLELHRGQRTHKWYGEFVGDSEPPPGRSPKDYGKCDHALSLKNARPGDYEIGVVAALDGDGYDLLVDTWGQARLLQAVDGPAMNKLRREYSAALTIKRAKQKLGLKGFTVQRKDVGNRIQVRLVRR